MQLAEIMSIVLFFKFGYVGKQLTCNNQLLDTLIRAGY